MKKLSIILLILILGSCSSYIEPTVEITQVIWFETPFIIYGDPLGPKEGNIVVTAMFRAYGKLTYLTFFGPGTMDDMKTLTSFVGKKKTVKDLESYLKGM